MFPSGSVEDRPSKKVYQNGMGWCGWKSNEATGGAPSGAAGDEERPSAAGRRRKRRAWIAGTVNGEATTSARPSKARRLTCVRLRAIVTWLLARRELRGAGRPSSSDPPDRPDRYRSRRQGGQNPRKLVGDETGEPSCTGTFGSRGSERVNVHGGPVHLIRSRVGGSSRIDRPCAEPEGDDRHVSGRRCGPRGAGGKMDGHA